MLAEAVNYSVICIYSTIQAMNPTTKQKSD
jgi:hypothetical protein